MNERVRLNIEMADAERQALKRLALDRHTTVKALVTEALSTLIPIHNSRSTHVKAR